jgi:ATPase subunit of ABC transporter with duplicated ATPase domains
MLVLQNISYTHPNRELLFSSLNLALNKQEKVALVGNNGVGKSTLLKIIAGELQPSGGQRHVDAVPYHVPQMFGQYNHLTIAQALQIEHKLRALKEALRGNITPENLSLLNDDWTLEERCNDAMQAVWIYRKRWSH